MVLTGIAQENDFMGGGVQYFLIFNKGQLRLLVPEETATMAIQHLEGQQEKDPLYVPAVPTASEEPEEGADVFSALAEENQDLSDYAQPPDHEVTETEEDVDDGVVQI